MAEGLKAGDTTTATTDLSSSEKHITPNQKPIGANTAQSSEDISPEGLLNVIS